MSNDGDPGVANGRTVGGRYRLLERIGSGVTGTVWRARDLLVEREVAVKEPRLPGKPGDEAHRRAAHRLYREARAAARVEHPCAVALHDVVVEEGEGLRDGPPWIVMELVRGESLDEVLRRGPLDPAEAGRIGLAVLGALRAAHAVGIVHRDVKPANVLLEPQGRVVLTDFGIAHLQGEEHLTADAGFAGSPDFVAPERMSGRGAGPASDLWSLGALLYAVVEGRSPFRRTTVEATLAAILAADPPEPGRAGPLAPLLTRLLARDPDRRPDPAEAAAALEAASRGGRPAPPATTEPPGPQDAARSREFGNAAATVRTGAEAGAESTVPRRESTVPQGTPRFSQGGPAGPQPGPAAGEPSKPASASDPAPVPASASDPAATPGRTSLLRRPVPLTLLALLLLAGAGLALPFLLDADRGVATEGTAAPAPTPASPASWTAHRETGMGAVLSLPAEYRESARQGGAGEQPRLVVYSAGSVDVRLTQWDRAPGSPLGRAAEARETWDGHGGDTRTRTARTVFRGHQAALADTTYGPDASPTRVMELFVLADDSRMYELRVDMPKGTADEEQGTAVFAAARDRLRIGVP